MTGILNRLERAGYVTRRAAPQDRRRVRMAPHPRRWPGPTPSTSRTTSA
ncbi:MarR family transcriptional regulator [Streptomyces sp. ID05-04B]